MSGPQLLSLPTNVLQSLWPEEALWKGLAVSRRLQGVLGWWAGEGARGEEVDRDVFVRVSQDPDAVTLDGGVQRDDYRIFDAVSTLSKLHWKSRILFEGVRGGLGELLLALRGIGAERIVALEWLLWEQDQGYSDENNGQDDRDARRYGALLLAEGLRGTTNLKQLELRACLSQIDDLRVARALFGSISICTSLTALNLADNNLVGQRLQDCLSVLTKLTHLENIWLDQNGMDLEDYKVLAAFLPKMRLTGLQLAMASLWDEGAQELASALCLCTGMTSLRLGDAGYDANEQYEETFNLLGSLAGPGFARCLPMMEKLEELNLTDVEIQEPAVAGLAAGLAGCASLKRLDLASCLLSDAGITGLAPALAQCSSLRELDMSVNEFGDDGAVRLAESLAACTALRQLSLHGNALDTEGARAIINVLPSLVFLNQLWLEDCVVQADGFLTLAPVVRAGVGERPSFRMHISRDVSPGLGNYQPLIEAMAPPRPEGFRRSLWVYYDDILTRTSSPDSESERQLVELAASRHVELSFRHYASSSMEENPEHDWP